MESAYFLRHVTKLCHQYPPDDPHFEKLLFLFKGYQLLMDSLLNRDKIIQVNFIVGPMLDNNRVESTNISIDVIRYISDLDSVIEIVNSYNWPLKTTVEYFLNVVRHWFVYAVDKDDYFNLELASAEQITPEEFFALYRNEDNLLHQVWLGSYRPPIVSGPPSRRQPRRSRSVPYWHNSYISVFKAL